MSDINHPHNTTHTHTTVRETRERETRGNSGLAFIVGIVVVVLAVLAWIVFGGADTSPTVTDGAGGDVNVTIQDEAAPADSGATATVPAPDAEPAAPEAAAPDAAAPAADADAETAPAN